MNIKYLNESFKRLYEEAIDYEPAESSFEHQLRKQLTMAKIRLQYSGATNIKEYEIAFQEAIENMVPDKSWWEVTDCNIFFTLFETRSPELTVEQIIAELKPEYKETVKESFEEDIIDKNKDDKEHLQENTNREIFINDDMDECPYLIGESEEDVDIADRYDLSEDELWATGWIGSVQNTYEGPFKSFDEIDIYCYDREKGEEYDLPTIPEDVKVKFLDLINDWVNNYMNDDFDESLTESSERKIAQIPMWAYNIWYRDVQGSVTGDIASILSMGELMELWNKECDSDPSMQEFDSWDEWWAATQKFMERSKARHGATMDPRYDAIFREKLEECLKRLNEAQISDEDKRDSDLIRSMLAKIEKRSNARFTPEEQAVLDKYGIKRNPYQRDLEVAGRPLISPVDSKHSTSSFYGRYNNGNHKQINYADRARKLPQRQGSQVYGDHAGTRYISGNDWVNRHQGPKPALNPNKPNYRRRNDYKNTLQSAERDQQNTTMHQPIDDMQRALGDRRYHQREVDQSQSKYDQAAAAARKTYDDSMRRAQSYLDDAQPGGYHYDRVQRAQGEVDKLLKRKPKED